MRRVVAATAILIGMALLLGSPGCSDSNNLSAPQSLTIAAVPTEVNALVYVAEDQGYFTDNGLQITLKDYDSGASAAAGMLNGEADVALAAEFPIVRQVFNDRDIVNFGTIARYENTYILWRAGNGIESIRDLKNKRVGVTLTTISEFYLGRTLDLNGMDIQQVTLVDVKAPDSEKALVNGDVDAVVTWEPWVHQIKERLGKEAVPQAVQSAQFAYWNLVSTSGWTRSHSDSVGRLLKSLIQAENFLARHNDEAKAIVRERMNFDSAYMDTIWPRYQFSLSLNQSLVTAMEGEARWMIANKLTTVQEVPDFMHHIEEAALKAAKPEAVNIIR